MSEPTGVGVVSVELLEALAAEAPAPETPSPAWGRPTSAPEGRYTSRLLVDRWLTNRGVTFRVKAQADGKGRTVYVLKECPFDPAHGDPDACVMQDAAGKMSAQCFHNSCQGRGWQAFKEAVGAPEAHHYDPPLARAGARTGRKRSKKHSEVPVPPPAPPVEPPPPAAEGGEPPLPTIQGNLRQLRDVTADATAALLARNDPPAVFQRGGVLTRLRVREETGAPFLEPLVDAALRGVLARAANWLKARQTQEGMVVEEDAPPIEVVKDLANLPRWDGVPVIEEVVECSVYARDGGLITAPGFHSAARLWHQPAPGLDVPEIPARPTAADLRRARDLLLIELLGDFPFSDDASRAHALAALLLPFVRRLVDGPTPLHLLDAPVEGTGKTLLANVIGLVSTGRPPEAMAEGSCDEEWRKRLTALLAEHTDRFP